MPTPRLSPQADFSPPLNSRAVLVLTALSYLFVGLAFSYLDRRYGSFGLEGGLWLGWTLLGFGAGTLNVGKPNASGQNQWVVLGSVGFLLALFPGFVMYNLLRWASVTLMIILGARAAILRTRRDFYLTLTVIFVVSFMAGTHGNADWTLWFYLGPAWVFGGLALAWEHALGVPLSRWTKMAMTLGFISMSLLLAAVLFFFAPRPPILGFGFLPPGTDTPGLYPSPAAAGIGKPTSGSGSAGSSAAPGQGHAGAPRQSELAQQWGGMLQSMRRAMSDRFIPEWQRSLIDSLLTTAQSLLGVLTGQAPGTADGSAAGSLSQEPSERSTFTVNWLLLLATLLAGYLLWRRRYRLGLGIALGASWLLAAHVPAQSMRLSAQAMAWCLHLHGHPPGPGQSVREHWGAAAGLAPLARHWLDGALETYCETRFGGLPATRQRALSMHQAVQGASDIMLGLMPELSQ